MLHMSVVLWIYIDVSKNNCHHVVDDFKRLCVLVHSFTATCEMCGMVGVRDAFYSKTKRFCSVSCSRSYSSNSKKASILARLQVRAF